MTPIYHMLESGQMLTVESATISDLIKLPALQRICFNRTSVPLLQLLYESVSKKVTYRVARVDGTVIGCIGLEQLTTEQCRINMLCTAPDYQRLGIGQRLLNTAHLHPLSPHTTHYVLHVNTTNAAAYGLYSRSGYVTQRTIPNYYRREKADAYYMQKTIS